MLMPLFDFQLTFDLKNEIKTAGVNEPSVFKPLKVYCMLRSELSEWKLEIRSHKLMEIRSRE